jgi:hypothetical protein
MRDESRLRLAEKPIRQGSSSVDREVVDRFSGGAFSIRNVGAGVLPIGPYPTFLVQVLRACQKTL